MGRWWCVGWLGPALGAVVRGVVGAAAVGAVMRMVVGAVAVGAVVRGVRRDGVGGTHGGWGGDQRWARHRATASPSCGGAVVGWWLGR